MKVFLIAGEPSGDALGAALMAGLADLAPGCRFGGVGGEEMTAAGLSSLFPMADLSVMGLAEVLPRLALLRRRIAQTAQAIADQKPDLVVTIDSPDFCLRVLRKARALRPDLPVVHYVAPSVWAWRPKRAARMAPLVDHVLALLPFEPPYMEAAGMSCDFVGHPVVAAPRASEAEARAIRQSDTVVLALPGSRAGEIARLAPRFGQGLGQALPPGAQVLVPTVAAQAEHMRAQVAAWPVPAQVVTDADQKRAAFRAADAALAASGTVSLELAANDTPMVIGYDMAWLTQRIAERLVKLDTVTLVNIVSDTRAVPEYLGRACTAQNLARSVRALLTEPARQSAQRAAMRLTMDRLGQGGVTPGHRAAASCLAFMARQAGGDPAPAP